MMTKEQKHQIDVYLDRAGGQNTSKMNVLHGEVVSLADALGAAGDPIIKKTLAAEQHNQAVGDTLAEFQTWANAQPLEGAAPPPPPAVPGQLTAGQAQQTLPLVANQLAHWTAMTDCQFSYATAPSGSSPTFYFIGDVHLTSTADPRWLPGVKGYVPWKQVKAGQKVSAYYGMGGGDDKIRADAYAP